MNRTQHYSLLKAMEIDKSNLLKYQELYKYAYILSDGIFKIVFAEEKDHTLLISLVNAMLGLQGDAVAPCHQGDCQGGTRSRKDDAERDVPALARFR